MADTAMTTAFAADNAFRAINTLALEVQARAREAAHLVAAIDSASDDLSYGGEAGGKSHVEAIDRIVVFCRLAREAARRAAELGEQIELAAKPGNTPWDVRDNRDDSALQASGPAAAIMGA
ncbi:hypothetical protein [Novosphingobium sp. PASSN1]|uniref:hypothetical protein n=1 Tax=Novosphingobium sp. PASSN1 TaxID=2015561 RepID=UPI0025EA60CB|nr:hypothetical protein [Novosphingobium sp. PASSN1]